MFIQYYFRLQYGPVPVNSRRVENSRIDTLYNAPQQTEITHATCDRAVYTFPFLALCLHGVGVVTDIQVHWAIIGSLILQLFQPVPQAVCQDTITPDLYQAPRFES